MKSREGMQKIPVHEFFFSSSCLQDFFRRCRSFFFWMVDCLQEDCLLHEGFFFPELSTPPTLPDFLMVCPLKGVNWQEGNT